MINWNANATIYGKCVGTNIQNQNLSKILKIIRPNKIELFENIEILRYQ